MLEISDLVKTYPNGLKALHGVSLTVDRPMVVAIIGSSGAGTSRVAFDIQGYFTTNLL